MILQPIDIQRLTSKRKWTTHRSTCTKYLTIWRITLATVDRHILSNLGANTTKSILQHVAPIYAIVHRMDTAWTMDVVIGICTITFAQNLSESLLDIKQVVSDDR